jgi:D-xylose transport system substrate-binding protein
METDLKEGLFDSDAPQQMKRRTFMTMAGALGAGAALASSTMLGSRNVFAADSKKIGFSFATYTVPRYVKLDLPVFQKTVAAAGYTTASLQADSKVDRQINDVQNLLGQEISALTLMAVTGESGVGLVRQCKQVGVPVIAYNQEIPSSDVSAYVARDNVAVGEMMVKGAETFLGGRLKGNFIIASGHPGDGVALGITKGYMQMLKPAIDRGDVKLISREFHEGWDPELARKQVENGLTRTNNNIQAVLCNNDGLAGGAIAALRAQGLAGKVYVCGLDATNEACRAILLGDQAFSVFTKYDEMAKRAADLSLQLAEGKTVSSSRSYPAPGGKSVPFFPTDSYEINRDNMVEYLKKYSPAYVDAQAILKGIPADKLPAGAKDLIKS